LTSVISDQKLASRIWEGSLKGLPSNIIVRKLRRLPDDPGTLRSDIILIDISEGTGSDLDILSRVMVHNPGAVILFLTQGQRSVGSFGPLGQYAIDAVPVEELSGKRLTNSIVLASRFVQMRRKLEEYNQELEALRSRRPPARPASDENGTSAVRTSESTALRNLIDGLTRDFDGNLTYIEGTSRELEREAKEPLSRSSLGRIAEKASASLRLIRQLSLYAQFREEGSRLTDLNESIREYLSRARKPGEDVSVEHRSSSEPCLVSLPPGSVDLVLRNLISNSVESLMGRGTIQITTSIEEKGGSRFALLEVSDDGEGMDERVLARAHEPFFTTKKGMDHPGLGLYIVQGIASASGGRMDVKSRPGEGTDVTLRFPIPERIESREATSPPLRGRGERLLVIEDKDTIREIVLGTLSQMGYVVFIARSSREASLLFGHEAGKFDLVISDLMLEGRSAVPLLERFSRERGGVHTILIVGEEDLRSHPPIILGKGISHLRVPFRPEDLLSEVRKVLGRSAPVVIDRDMSELLDM